MENNNDMKSNGDALRAETDGPGIDSPTAGPRIRLEGGVICWEEEGIDLKILYELEQENLSWQFNKIGIIVHERTGRIYWAATSGCSCPGHYHEYDWGGPDNTDLRELLPHTEKAFEAEVMAFPASMSKRLKFLRYGKGLKNAGGLK